MLGESTDAPRNWGRLVTDRRGNSAEDLETAYQRLLVALRVGEVGAFERDFEHDRMSWTPEFERLYGFEPGGMASSTASWTDHVHPDDFQRVMSHADDAIAEHREIAVEFRILKPDGEMRWMEARAAIEYDDMGRPLRIIGMNKDVTERKQAEENLAFLAEASATLASSLDYQTTLDAVARLAIPHIADWCTVDIFDEKGGLHLVSVAHIDPEKVKWARELRETNPVNMAAPSGLPQVLRTGRPELYPLITDEMLQATTSSEHELELSRTLGLTSVIIVPIRSAGRPIGGISLITTESRRRYTEADLDMAEELGSRASLAIDNARLYKEAQDAVRIRDEFISIASHELRTPITSLKVYTQVMRKRFRREDDAMTSGQLERMEAQIDKLAKLITDLLDVSKIETGRLEYRSAPFDIESLVREIVDQLRLSTETHEIDVEGEGPVTIAGDADRIGQIITNLLTNAIKYSPKADRVLVRVEPRGETVAVSVQDFGIGIDPRHQAEVFERFYRVTGPDERTYPGLGIGLYIAREIARRHGGDVAVESTQGEGSTFTLVLPIHSAVTGVPG